MNNFAKLYTRAGSDLLAPSVVVEAHISSGLPTFIIVGLLETAVKESKERVRSAIINSNFKFPSGRITVSLGPANLPKKGGRYDLAIALCILIASGQVAPSVDINNIEIYGELSLDGKLNSIDGLFPAVLACGKQQKTVIIPNDCDENLSLIKNVRILIAIDLLQVCGFLAGQNILEMLPKTTKKLPKNSLDLADVKGQFLAKRVLEIAASGRHNLLLSGPPGSGKTMLANRITTIMPSLSLEQKLEVMAIYSIAGKQLNEDNGEIVFRMPHHTASAVALVGGGANPKPGEISLAHNGVLFLDELPEFSRNVLEVLRQPLESGEIHISRAQNQVSYPANFQLIAAQNPCICGYYGDGSNKCHCTSDQIERYNAKISGPLLDRIDMVLSVIPLPKKDLIDSRIDIKAESSEVVRKRVLSAYNKQIKRQGKTNNELTTKEIERLVILDTKSKQLLEQAIDKFNLSARAYHRIFKVARTIADLDDLDKVSASHLSEALQYRRE